MIYLTNYNVQITSVLAVLKIVFRIIETYYKYDNIEEHDLDFTLTPLSRQTAMI